MIVFKEYFYECVFTTLGHIINDTYQHFIAVSILYIPKRSRHVVKHGRLDSLVKHGLDSISNLKHGLD